MTVICLNFYQNYTQIMKTNQLKFDKYAAIMLKF